MSPVLLPCFPGQTHYLYGGLIGCVMSYRSRVNGQPFSFMDIPSPNSSFQDKFKGHRGHRPGRGGFQGEQHNLSRNRNNSYRHLFKQVCARHRCPISESSETLHETAANSFFIPGRSRQGWGD